MEFPCLRELSRRSRFDDHAAYHFSPFGIERDQVAAEHVVVFRHPPAHVRHLVAARPFLADCHPDAVILFTHLRQHRHDAAIAHVVHDDLVQPLARPYVKTESRWPIPGLANGTPDPAACAVHEELPLPGRAFVAGHSPHLLILLNLSRLSSSLASCSPRIARILASKSKSRGYRPLM